MDTLTVLNEIFCQVFDDDLISVTRETTASDIDGWDSLTHMNLVIAVEMRFRIKIALGEMQTLKNVGDMIDLIDRKTAKK